MRPPGADYTISYSKLRRKKIVEYPCPSCGEGLWSPLAKAGDKDECPDCGAAFVVPGQRERDVEEQKRQADAAHQKWQERDAELRAKAAQAATKEKVESKARKRSEREAERKRQTPMTRPLRVTGIVLMTFGCLGLFGHWLAYDITAGAGLDRVVNLGKTSDRLIGMLASATFFLGGWIALAIDMLAQEVNRWGRKITHSDRI